MAEARTALTSGAAGRAGAAGGRRGAGGRPWWRRRWIYWAAGAAALLAGAGLFLLRPFWKLSSHFEEVTFRQPSRLYAQPAELEAGRPYPPERMLRDLLGEGYREEESPTAALAPGRFRIAGGNLAVHLRSFFLPDGRKGGGLLEVRFQGPRVQRLWLNGQPQQSAVLEPPLLASYYGPDLLERRPVTVDEVAPELIQAVVAAEDESFFTHSGVAPSSILRALWVNLRGGQVRQGGSTLTQQVVKNIYLTQERKLARKVEEAVLAVMLEMRYSKREILTAYLNEIYLGRSGGVNVMGMGAASRAYFGKDASQLSLAEAATLAGIIPAPALYSPLTHPERARERRDWVLHRIAALGRVDRARIEQALATPVVVSPEPLARRRAPYFADAVAAEAAKRFKVEDLDDSGYSLYSTLSWDDQQAAQAATDAGLAAAEKGYQKGNKASLQAALISIQPATGGILAYVGGRRYDQSQFDRVSQAFRQTGSAFKPIVYAAAFEERRATPATFLEDEPLTVEVGNASWSPKNDDGDYHGWVTVRTALEHSYNPATTRLALVVGIPKIVALAHALGIVSRMQPYPAVALGATAVAPIELGTVFASLAAGGVRPPVHGIWAVVDSHGKPVAGTALPAPERVLSPQTVFLVTSLLQGVLERGTGASAAPQLRGKLAGKTGTTNDRRDSWFGGYSPERSTVVWVGYDDNAVTRLSGARAALPIWSRFMTAVTPPGGYTTFPQPPGISSALIDPETGLLATEYCPQVFTEFFRKQDVPTEVCNLHLGFGDQFAAAPPPAALRPAEDSLGQGQMAPRSKPAEPRRGTHPFRRWLRRLFGGGGGGGDADDADADKEHGGRGQDDGRDKGDRGRRDGGTGTRGGAGRDAGDEDGASDGGPPP
ncbi:MAG TPA: PBP1A family penicillin-binding protein [Thermoanaerobaculia bacterium]|nr:PBP1A family penicillin-binding protein [Thermoanaerobaculia bacterium]